MHLAMSVVLLLLVLGGWGDAYPALAAEVLPETASEDGAKATDNQSPVPSLNLQVEDISSEKVSQFVDAYVQVLALVERREGELQAAETQLESVRVQQEIEAAAFSVIESTGLTRQEYIQLLGLANSDAEFGERIITQLQDGSL
jgi:hypothetical protein